MARALTKNYDVGLAYAAVQAARENLVITHADELPAAAATLGTPYEFQAGNLPASAPTQAFAPQLALNASYQIDVFGKLRSATAVTRAQLLASQAAYDTVVWTLVSRVATSYFQLRELDSVLDLSLVAQKQREEEFATRQAQGAVR